MRKEPFGVGSIVHVVKRGSRGNTIVRDEEDRWRFLLMLTHLNSVDPIPSQWFRELQEANCVFTLARPNTWPQRRELVHILAFCLVENHFHLLLEETQENGISKFMHKFSISMSKHFNERHKEQGALFQGSFRSRTIADDVALRYVSAYIQVKNAFDVYPEGHATALKHFDHAYEWAIQYPFCSLGDYVGVFQRPILHTDLFANMFTQEEYKCFAEDIVFGRLPKSDVEI